MNEDAKKELAKQKSSEWFKIYADFVAKSVQELQSQALLAYPSQNTVQDYYQSGFRHGVYVGMFKLIELIEEAGKVEEKLDKKKL